MSSIVTITGFGDYHAILMDAAFEALGVNHFLWEVSDFPSEQTISKCLNYNNDKLILKSKRGNSFDFDNVNVVWNRRPNLGNLLSENIHPGDVKFVKGEVSLFLRSIWLSMDRRFRIVNSTANKFSGEAKLIQLEVAHECGLRVPATLISNDFDEINTFVNSQRSVYKAFHCSTWEVPTENSEKPRWLACYTTEIEKKDFDFDSVSISPGIYQELIEKDYELRVILAGSDLMAVKIHSQDCKKTNIDFRPGQPFLKLEEVQLPSDIREKIFHFAKKLGLVFGSLDIIVTPDGEYVFLEINEQGQFLWIEDNNPEIPVTQFVADFLQDGTDRFIWKRPERCIKLKQLETNQMKYKFSEITKFKKFHSLHIHHGNG